MGDSRDEAGRFLPGNRIWEARSTAGPKPKFKTSEELWAACCEYFAWVHENPLLEGIAYQGAVSDKGLPKMRPFTITGLCIFLDISRSTWDEWRRTRPDLSDTITMADQVIYTQKFEGAAAGMLNANLISRELGLADRQEVTGKDGGAIETKDVSDVELARQVAFMLAAAVKENGDAD